MLPLNLPLLPAKLLGLPLSCNDVFQSALWSNASDHNRLSLLFSSSSALSRFARETSRPLTSFSI
jgi:hypothetical protein